jgi:CubicO group peptidase (beta-lactamase class C family)
MSITIEGTAAPGFEQVAEAFAANFSRHGDVGAAVCVYRHGEPVVDLWAGLADPQSGRPWARDTLQLVYSATKGVVATAAHLLAERGELDLDAPVAAYWPEFAAAGKADVPVRWLLSHQAGLPVLDKPVPIADALAWDPVVEALAAQAPVWTPGTAHGYHMHTYGWLVGEVIRRVTGRTVGQFVAGEIAGPLDADFFIGLPDAQRPRVSTLVYAPPPDLSKLTREDVPEQFRGVFDAASDPDSLMNRPLTDGVLDYNAPEVQRAELPASNGIGTARSLARMYAALIGEVDGVRLLRPETLAAATREQAAGIDRVSMTPSRYASGYQLPTPGSFLPSGPPTSFGHPGRSGALAWADPQTGLAFAYVTNYVVVGSPDPRATSLVAALG